MLLCYVRGSDQSFTTSEFDAENPFTAEVNIYYCDQLIYTVPSPVINSNNSVTFTVPNDVDLKGRVNLVYEVRTQDTVTLQYEIRARDEFLLNEYTTEQHVSAPCRATLDFTFPTLGINLLTYTAELLLGSGGSLPVTPNGDGTISLFVSEFSLTQTDYRIRLESPSGEISFPFGGLIWCSPSV